MKKKRIIAGIIVVAFCVLLGIVIDLTHTVTITYHLNGNEDIQQVYRTALNKDIEFLTPQLTEENDEFIGWYLEPELKTKVDSGFVVDRDIDLYAGICERGKNTEFKLPEIYIRTDTALSELDRYEYSVCTYTMTNTLQNFGIKDASGYVRGRGNSTWQYFEKKPFRIKFDEKIDLLGMGEDKDWVLLSNAVDYTLMRNDIAMNIANILGLSYTPECRWVQIFYNDEYLGIYLLCEQVETGKNRVDIEIPYGAEDIDINYLLELGGELEGFTLPEVEDANENWGNYFSCEIVYPKKNMVTKDQKEYLETYMQLVNSAILERDWEEIQELVDVDSFAEWYLVNEIMLNGDMGWSMFAYKKQGEKLYLGPVWDFDQSCGVSGTGGNDYETWYPETSSQNAWFNSLIEMQEFRDVLSKHWNNKLPEIKEFLIEERGKSELYRKDIEANYERWDVLGRAEWRMLDEIGKLKTYDENVDYLFEWLGHRIDWINNELGN